MRYITWILLFISFNSFAQIGLGFDEDDDLNVGGDIFQDFNEDLEASQVMEDERFYRYSRFASVNLGVGATTFDGNRGLAYTDNHPSFGMSVMYFLDFQNVFIIGFEYSQHTMFIDTFVNGYKDQIIGAVETSFLRPFIGIRYYIDTSDLGTAITYSNPYFVGRVEYWYQTNTFSERDDLSDETGGGIGIAGGVGLEFPIELKKSYFNIEFLFHTVNYFDKFTQDYRKIPEGQEVDGNESKYGYEDLSGNAYSVFFNYVISY
jgi:hypothetical protein